VVSTVLLLTLVVLDFAMGRDYSVFRDLRRKYFAKRHLARVVLLWRHC
jgi:hypothetical protein